MSLLAPLGLIALISLAVLILIYIIKPNYQQKLISSTFVWKLSLKYRKKRVPINKFRNILIFICQFLALTSCAFIISQPVIAAENVETPPEYIVIIDASASMRAQVDGETRFERAIKKAGELSNEAFEKNGWISVIVAGEKAYPLVPTRAGVADKTALETSLKNLIVSAEGDLLGCTFGRADIDGAIDLAEPMVAENPDAVVKLITGTRYIEKGNIEIIDISEDREWNAAILDVRAEIVDNMYNFDIDVAVYGRDMDLEVFIDVKGANFNGEKTSTYRYRKSVQLSGNMPATLTLVTSDEKDKIFNYEEVWVHFGEDGGYNMDSFWGDNEYHLYGKRQPLKIQYYSTLSNNFFSGAFNSLRNVLRNTWNVEYREVPKNSQPEISGYDLYVFEHKMPTTIPTDGVVILMDIDKVPENVNIKATQLVGGDFVFAPTESHPIMNRITASDITATRYQRIPDHEGFDVLMTCGEKKDPVLLVKNTVGEKVVIMPFSLNYSNLAVLFDFPKLMYNIVNYFIPPTLNGMKYEVGDTVPLNCRGPSLSVSGPYGFESAEYEEFPIEIKTDIPGTYTLTQMSPRYDDDKNIIMIIDSFYVQIAPEQSNIFREEDSLKTFFVAKKPEPVDVDLLIYFAAALVTFLFAEWILHSLEQF